MTSLCPGKRLGRLVVERVAPPAYVGHHLEWICRCNCGARIRVVQGALTRGRVRACEDCAGVPCVSIREVLPGTRDERGRFVVGSSGNPCGRRGTHAAARRAAADAYRLMVASQKAITETDIASRVDRHLARMRAAFPGIVLTRTNAIRALVLKALQLEEQKVKQK